MAYISGLLKLLKSVGCNNIISTRYYIFSMLYLPVARGKEHHVSANYYLILLLSSDPHFTNITTTLCCGPPSAKHKYVDKLNDTAHKTEINIQHRVCAHFSMYWNWLFDLLHVSYNGRPWEHVNPSALSSSKCNSPLRRRGR